MLPGTRPPKPGSALGYKRPTSEYVRKKLQSGDPNPRYRYYTRYECSYVEFTRYECSFVEFTRFECSFAEFTRFECSFSFERIVNTEVELPDSSLGDWDTSSGRHPMFSQQVERAVIQVKLTVVFEYHGAKETYSRI